MSIQRMLLTGTPKEVAQTMASWPLTLTVRAYLEMQKHQENRGQSSSSTDSSDRGETHLF